jgi:hypothetical protein
MPDPRERKQPVDIQSGWTDRGASAEPDSAHQLQPGEGLVDCTIIAEFTDSCLPPPPLPGSGASPGSNTPQPKSKS